MTWSSIKSCSLFSAFYQNWCVAVVTVAVASAVVPVIVVVATAVAVAVIVAAFAMVAAAVAVVIVAAVADLSLRFTTYLETKDDSSWAHEYSCKILCQFF